MTRPAVAAATVVIAVCAGALPASAQAGVTDPSGDTVDCSTNEPLDRPAGDILAARLENDRIVIDMARAIGQILDPDENYSAALRVFAFDDSESLIKAWLVQVHDGERTEAELDTETGEPIDSDIDVSATDSSLSIGVDGATLDDASDIGIEAFNMPEEGDPTSCDRLLAPVAQMRTTPDDGAVDEPADDEPAGEPAADGGSAAGPILGLLAAAAALGGLLAWLFGPWSWARGRGGSATATSVSHAAGGGPCEEAYERWQYWQHICDEERAEHEKGEASDRERLVTMRERLGNLESWETIQREVLEEAIGRFEDRLDHPPGEGLTALCDEAAKAKNAFDECVAQSNAPEGPAEEQPVDAATSTPEETGTAVAPPSAPVATTPEPGPSTRERRCPEGARRNERWERQPSVELVIDFEVRLISEGTRYRATAEDAREMGKSLEEIAKTLEELAEGKLPGTAGEVQELRDSFANLGGHLEELAEKGAAEYAEQQLKAQLKSKVDEINGQLQAAAESASGIPWSEMKDAATKVPELLQNPGKASLEILRMTAELGAKVAMFCGRLIERTDLYKMVVVMKTMRIDVMWHHWEVCVDGQWRRTGKVLAPNGPITERIWKTVSDIPGPAHSGNDFRDELIRLERAADGEMRRSNGELAEALNPPFGAS